MRARPFTTRRPALLRERELEAIGEAALRVLEEIGIEISNADLQARARSRGFRLENGRLRLPRRQVSAYLEEARSGGRGRRRSLRPAPDPTALTLGISGYAQRLHDPETGRIVPLTSAGLVEATRLVAVLRDCGLSAAVPGCPVDVPPALQPLLQYRIAVENLPGGTNPVDPKHVESLPYIMEMADVVGHPIRSLPVYVFSPLRLGGESLGAVMAYQSRLERVVVAAMPAAGWTAPARPAEAFAVAAAEVIGSALILRECLGMGVDWAISLYPFDLHGMAMSFGSPESLLLQAASSEVEAYFRGTDWWPAVGNIHTLAKEPGAQAAAEKMGIMLTGALWGGRHFDSAGSLSLDEVFSPVQLLVDIELKGHVQRVVEGLETGCNVEACLADVQEALDQGFAGLERTVRHYRDLYWHPELFERRFLGPWEAAGSRRLEERARQTIAKLIMQHDYQPPADVAAELERIYRRAESELAAAQ